VGEQKDLILRESSATAPIGGVCFSETNPREPLVKKTVVFPCEAFWIAEGMISN
jgi:hypothetical protein